MLTDLPWKFTGFQASAAGTDRARHSERKSQSSSGRDCDTRRRFFYRLDLRVQPPADRVGDAMIEVGQHILQVVANHSRHLLDGLQSTMRCPEVPLPPEQLGPAAAAIVPQFP